MLADPAAQMRLLDLAALDIQTAQLQHRRKTLPEHAAIAELMEQRKRAGDAQVAAATRLGDAESDLARIDSDLEPARARLDRNQQRVDGGTLEAKALTSMLEELTHLKGRIFTLEDDELEAMQAVEDLTADRDRIIAARHAMEERIRTAMAKRDSQLADLDADLAERATRRAALVAGLPADLVALYERIAARNAGRGAAELKAGRCQGCQLELSATDLQRFANAPADEVLRCEECDRILVRTPESGL